MRTFDPPFDRTFWASMPKVEPYLFIAKNDNSSANLTVQYPTTKIIEYSLGNTEAYIIVQHNAVIETWLALSTYSHTRRWGILHGCHYAHGDTNYDQDAAWFSPSYFLNGKWELIDNRNIKLYGSHLPILGNQFSPSSTAADAPFSTIMSDLLTNTVTKKITLNYESNQEWHTWDFEKAGTFTISDLRNLNQILARKYLVNIFTRSFDGSSTQLLLKNRYLTAPSTSFDYFGTATFNKPEEPDYLSLSYIDETDTLTVVDAYSKKHFLGFIPSTADVTELTQSAFTLPPYFSITNCFDPRLENGDLIKIDYPSNMPGSSTSASSIIEVIETYNEKGLRTEIKGVPFPDGVTKQGSYKLSNQSTSIKTRIETDQFNGVLSNSDNNVQAAMDTIDDHDHSGLATTEGIQDVIGAMLTGNTETGIAVTYDDTNGKLDFDAQTAGDARYTQTAHDHNGGDGGTIAYSSLSGTPTAETNSNDIFRVDNPGGVSLWTGTISGAPSGASVTVSAPASGTEAVLVPTSTSQLAKMRLYNLTRGTSALISNYNTGTNVITLTANAPAAWANGDSLTIVSQTVSGGGFNWIDLEITSGLTGKNSIFAMCSNLAGAAGDVARTHPLETFGAGKVQAVTGQVAGVVANGFMLIKATSNVFSLSWSTAPTAVVIRETGYLS